MFLGLTVLGLKLRWRKHSENWRPFCPESRLETTSTSSSTGIMTTLKDLRTERLTKLSQELTSSDRLLATTVPSVRTVTRRLQSLIEAYHEYDKSHIKYLARLTEEDVQDMQQAHNDIVDRCDLALDNLENLKASLEAPAVPTIIETNGFDEKANVLQRIEGAKTQVKERLIRFGERLNGTESPNANLVSRLTQQLGLLRRELEVLLETEFIALKATAVSEEDLIAIEVERTAQILRFHGEVDNYLQEMDSAIDVSAFDPAPRGHEAVRPTSYKAYAKEAIPAFKGQLRLYPAWRREMVELILPGLEEVHQIRILEKHSPIAVDLQNCTTTVEAWTELDARYGNSINITTTLVDEFLKLKIKSRSDQSKVVEVKESVMRLSSDLKAVKFEDNLHNNPYILNHIVKMMPPYWQNKYSEQKASLMAGDKTQWDAISGFLKSEAHRLNTELPWTLDSYSATRTEESSEEGGAARGKAEKKRINALAVREPAKRMGRSQEPPPSDRLEEMKVKIGVCPNCKVHHYYTSRSQELFVSGSLSGCDYFSSLSPQMRAELVVKLRACAQCLRWDHQRAECVYGKRACGVQSCTLLHNAKIHGTRVHAVNSLVTGCAFRPKKGGISQDDCEEPPMMFLHFISHRFKHKSITLTLFLDDGSECSLITTKAAGFLSLRGVEKLTHLLGAGQAEPDVALRMHYEVSIPTIDGQVIKVSCIGVDTITTNPARDEDLGVAYNLFPHVPKGALKRPTEEVSILIGQNAASLLAIGGDGNNICGNLRVLRCRLGSGWILGGWDSRIKPKTPALSLSANFLRTARILPQRKTMRMNAVQCQAVRIFPEFEDLSCQLPRRCNRCRNCAACRYEVQEVTRKEQEQLTMIRNSITLDKVERVCKVTYPVIAETSSFRNNEWQAVAMATSLEKQLIKKGAAMKQYNGEWEDMENRGAIIQINRREVDEWEKGGGVVSFISHHGVERPDKATSKMRPVANSSLKNSGRGPSPNSVWAKGPNSLRPLLEVFLRFRSYEHALHFDLSKMFHSVKTGEAEKYMRLMVWRGGLLKEPWKIYGFQVVAFGDVPATCTLELCKTKVAEDGAHIDEKAARSIDEDCYVDDACTGGSKEEVDRMIGEVEEKDDGSLHYSGTIQQILSRGGFKVKMMVRTGEQDERALSKMGGAVLGHTWNPEKDYLEFKPKVFLGKKQKNGLYAGEELTIDSLGNLTTFRWSRRLVLSTIASIYDPSGLISAFTIKFKLFLRQICLKSKDGWDEPLCESLQSRWEELVKELVTLEPIRIRRSVKPPGSVGLPHLVVMSDGSNVAYAAVAYLVYETRTSGNRAWQTGLGDDKEFTSTLLIAKSRVAPLAGTTAPRSEMNGHVMGVRLANVVLRSLPEKPSKLTFLLDSECTIAAVESEHGHLSAYLANRRAEVLETVREWKELYPGLTVEPLYHLAGPLNTSDLATRDTVVAEQVGEGSEWQNGPNFLTKSRDEWPVTREFRDKCFTIPEEELANKPVYKLLNSLKVKTFKCECRVCLLFLSLQNILNYSESKTKCVGILARLLRLSRFVTQNKKVDASPGFYQPTKQMILSNLKKPLEPESILAAEVIALRLSQPGVNIMLNSPPTTKKGTKNPGGKRKTVPIEYLKRTSPANQDENGISYISTCNMASLSPFRQDGIWWTQGRFGLDLKRVLGPEKLAILPASSSLAFLMMVESHNEAHRGGGDTCFRSRTRAWIVKARQLADKVTRGCHHCRRTWKVFQSQQAGKLPFERTNFPCKPWTSTGIDLLGPYEVRAMNNQRSKLKVWPIIFACMSTGALHVEVSHTFGADAFLTSFGSFVAVRGRPTMVYSDRGSQICKASQYVKKDEDPAAWGWSTIEEEEGRAGTSFRFTPPHSQWRSGLAEQRVRAVKECLDLLMVSGANSLNYAEFLSLLRRCANIINDRPLGVRHHSTGVEDEILPITPNLLLLGRTSTGPLDTVQLEEEEDKFSRRASFIAELEGIWWGMWFRQCFDSLLPYRTWKDRKQNLEVGDVCLMGWEEKLGKGSYRLCRIVDVEIDETSLVRTVTVESRPRASRERGLPYRSKDLERKRIAIQHLVLICPVEKIPTEA